MSQRLGGTGSLNGLDGLDGRDVVPGSVVHVRGGTGCAGWRVSDRSSGTAFRSRVRTGKEEGEERTERNGRRVHSEGDLGAGATSV